MRWAGEPDAEELRRSLFALAVATGIGSAVASLGYRHVPGLGLWQDVQLSLISAAAAGLLLLRRKTLSAVACRGVFLAIIAAALVTMTVNQHQLATGGRLFLPLIGHKALLLAVGIIAPG